MSSIQDLRDTLESVGQSVCDDGLPCRAAAVHRRVRGVRRRRQSIGAALVAVVVAIGAVTLISPNDEQIEPASRKLAGFLAPETLMSTGYTYEFDRGVESADGEALFLELEKSDRPRLVSWAAMNVDRVVIQLSATEGEAADKHFAEPSGFDDFEWVPAGIDFSIALSSEDRGVGDFGLAVYNLSAEPPPGVTKDGITFRQTTASHELAGAAIGDRGVSEVSFEVTIPDGPLQLATFCQASAFTSRDGAPWVVYSVEGDQVLEGGCVDQLVWDPAIGADLWRGGWGGPYEIGGYSPGERVTITAQLIRAAGDRRPLTDPEARLGVGLYRLVGTVEQLSADQTARNLVENYGHTWALDSVLPGSGKTQTFELEARWRERFLGVVTYNFPRTNELGVMLDGLELQRIGFGDSAYRNGSFDFGLLWQTPTRQSFDGSSRWIPEKLTVDVKNPTDQGDYWVLLYRRADELG